MTVTKLGKIYIGLSQFCYRNSIEVRYKDSMELRTVLDEMNNIYKEAKRKGEVNEEDFIYNLLLTIGSLKLCAEDIKIALMICLNINKHPSAISWNSLRREIIERYMLDIGEEEKPIIKPSYGCWFNIEKRTLSAKKDVEWFEEEDCCIWVDDYRMIDENISWKDLVI